MTTPIAYYGGKQKLVNQILPMFPPHIQYVEPFCGGASLFWAKKKTKNEVINDYDLRVFNFWNVCKTNFDELNYLVQHTLHHEEEHKKAKEILMKGLEDPILFAWAFWVQCTMSFSHKIYGGFAFSHERVEGSSTKFKRAAFTSVIYDRLKDVQIFNRDAIELILLKDDQKTFFYFDPPYAESNCGHYEEGKDVYYKLLEILPSLKSKWLMSSYLSEHLTSLRKTYNWNEKNILLNLSVSGKLNEGKTKTECLTYNYKYQGQSISLF